MKAGMKAGIDFCIENPLVRGIFFVLVALGITATMIWAMVELPGILDESTLEQRKDLSHTVSNAGNYGQPGETTSTSAITTENYDSFKSIAKRTANILPHGPVAKSALDAAAGCLMGNEWALVGVAAGGALVPAAITVYDTKDSDCGKAHGYLYKYLGFAAVLIFTLFAILMYLQFPDNQFHQDVPYLINLTRYGGMILLGGSACVGLGTAIWKGRQLYQEHWKIPREQAAEARRLEEEQAAEAAMKDAIQTDVQNSLSLHTVEDDADQSNGECSYTNSSGGPNDSDGNSPSTKQEKSDLPKQNSEPTKLENHTSNGCSFRIHTDLQQSNASHVTEDDRREEERNDQHNI